MPATLGILTFGSMNGERIRGFYLATPFQAFRVHMANGRSVDVPHPDFMHLSPTDRWLTVDKADDSFELVDVLLVTSLEKLARNGTSRRKRGKSKS